MPANLRLVAHAAERDAGKLASQRIGHAPAERGLANARRADEAKNRPFQFVLQLDDRQELQQAVLYFAQSVMLLVENLGRGGEVNFVLGRFRPGQADNPIEVIPRDGVFRSGRRDLLQTVQFLERDFLRVFRKIDLFNLFAQGVCFGRGGIGLAEFALNGADLLAEEEIALAFAHGGGDFLLDFRSERQHFEFAAHEGQQAAQALLDHVCFQQMLAFLEAEVEVGRDEVGQFAGMLGVERRHFDLVGHCGRKVDDFLKLTLRVARHGDQFQRLFRDIADHLDFGAEIRLVRFVLPDAKPPQPLDQHAHGVVRELQHLQHAHRATVVPQVLGRRIFNVRFLLQNQTDEPVTGHHVVNQPNAGCRFHQQRCHHARENNDVRKAENRQRVRQRFAGP